MYPVKEYDKHYFLYAKGWYKQTNRIDDLIKIHQEWCGVNDVDLKYAIDHLLEIAIDIILKDQNKYKKGVISELVYSLDPSNYTFKGDERRNFSFNELVIDKCLSILRFTETNGLNPDTDLDENILPLTNTLN